MGWKRSSDRGNTRNGQGKVKTERQSGAFRGKMKNHPVLAYSLLKSMKVKTFFLLLDFKWEWW